MVESKRGVLLTRSFMMVGSTQGFNKCGGGGGLHG